MKKIELTEELIAAVARQGVTICGTEAEIVLAYIKVHGYELLTDDDYKLYLHDESAGEDNSYDEPQTVRDIVELCKELNEEMLLDSYSTQEQDADDQLELRKDTLVLETLLAKAEKVIPPTVRRYDVVVIEHRKKLVPVLAASWAEAEERVRVMWNTGAGAFGRDNFHGLRIGSEGEDGEKERAPLTGRGFGR